MGKELFCCEKVGIGKPSSKSVLGYNALITLMPLVKRLTHHFSFNLCKNNIRVQFIALGYFKSKRKKTLNLRTRWNEHESTSLTFLN